MQKLDADQEPLFLKTRAGDILCQERDCVQFLAAHEYKKSVEG